jgi:hypothetical protein
VAASLPVINLHKTTFECSYGRGCEGLCCRNGRPGVSPEEIRLLDANIAKFRPELRPEAREMIEEQGYLSNRVKEGRPMMRVLDGWRAFSNQGCVLHKIGAGEDDKYRYKPLLCSVFPLGQDHRGRWYVWQRGVNGEVWNLFCLEAGASQVPAAQSLQEEIDLVTHVPDATPSAKTG